MASRSPELVSRGRWTLGGCPLCVLSTCQSRCAWGLRRDSPVGAGLSLAQHIWSKETSLDFSQLSVSQLSSSFGMDSRESFLSIWVLSSEQGHLHFGRPPSDGRNSSSLSWLSLSPFLSLQRYLHFRLKKEGLLGIYPCCICEPTGSI